MSEVIDGSAIASRLREQIAQVTVASGVTPGLATVLVGEDPASQSYVRSKQRACERCGFRAEDVRLPADTGQDELIRRIDGLNGNPGVHGILVQQPLPDHMDTEVVVSRVLPEKDVDGFHPVNLGALMRGVPSFWPCTPFGIIRLLEEVNAQVAGRHVVIVGRSLLVGKPLAQMLLRKGAAGGAGGGRACDATVTVCHSRTENLAEWTRRADILVAATGRAESITADMVKDGAIVIDVGINRVEDPTRERGYRLVGDVAYDEVAPKAGAITPVPGGVGPMTVTMLLYNTLQAAGGLRAQDRV